MATYIHPFNFNFLDECVEIDSGHADITIIDLWTAIKEAQASEEGIIYDPIAKASGLNNLGNGVQVGITVELLGNWQLCFESGNYIARISGGNLVGGPGGDPIEYSAGVQTLLLQSAASTVVYSGGGSGDAPTVEEIASEMERTGGYLDKIKKNTDLIPIL